MLSSEHLHHTNIYDYFPRAYLLGDQNDLKKFKQDFYRTLKLSHPSNSIVTQEITTEILGNDESLTDFVPPQSIDGDQSIFHGISSISYKLDIWIVKPGSSSRGKGTLCTLQFYLTFQELSFRRILRKF